MQLTNKVWWKQDNSPNLPNFSPSNFSSFKVAIWCQKWNGNILSIPFSFFQPGECPSWWNILSDVAQESELGKKAVISPEWGRTKDYNTVMVDILWATKILLLWIWTTPWLNYIIIVCNCIAVEIRDTDLSKKLQLNPQLDLQKQSTQLDSIWWRTLNKWVCTYKEF